MNKETTLDAAVVAIHLAALPALFAALFGGWWGAGWALLALMIYAVKRRESDRYARRWRFAVTAATVGPALAGSLLAALWLLGAILFLPA